MRIAFRKIALESSPFSLRHDGVVFEGSFQRERDKVVIQATLSGALKLPCDRCGELFENLCDERIQLKVHEGYYEGEDLDVIESHDHFVDFEKIAQSEIEAIRSQYHYCDKCKELEGE